MPSYQSDYEQVIAQRKKAAEAGRKSARYTGAAGSFEDQLRERIRERASKRGESKLGEMAGKLREEYAGAGAKIHEEYGAASPQARTSLISQRQADILGQLERVGFARQSREQGIEGMIGGAVRGVEAEAGGMQAQALADQQTYENIWREHQFAQQQALAYSQMAQRGAGEEKYPVEIPGYGTVMVTGAQALQYHQSQQTQLPVSAKNKISAYESLMQDVQTAREPLGDKRGILGDLFGGMTGPLAGRVLPEYMPGAGVRKSIADLEAGMKYGRYGGALTETEVAEYPKWGVSTTFQEQKNRNALDILYQKKLNERNTLLRSYGINPTEWDAMKQDLGGGGFQPPLSNFDR